MKIDFIIPKNATNQSKFGINISDMTSVELDQIRILLKTIFDYGQFSNSFNLSQQLNFAKAYMKSLKNA